MEIAWFSEFPGKMRQTAPQESRSKLHPEPIRVLEFNTPCTGGD